MRFAARSLTLVVPAALGLAVINYAEAQNIRGVALGYTRVSEIVAERGQPESEGAVEGGSQHYIVYGDVGFYFSVLDSIVTSARIFPRDPLTRAAVLRRLGQPRRTTMTAALGYDDIFADTLQIVSQADGKVSFLEYSLRRGHPYLAAERARNNAVFDSMLLRIELRRPAPFVAFGEILVGRFQPPPPSASDKGGYAIRTVPPAVQRRGLRVGDVVLYLSRVDSTGARYTVEVGDTVVRRLGGWQAAWLDLRPAHGDTVEISWTRGSEVGAVYVRHLDTPSLRTAKANYAVTWALINRLTSWSSSTELQLGAIDSLTALRRRAASSAAARTELRELERLVNRDSIIRSFQLRRRTP